jgi:transposase
MPGQLKAEIAPLLAVFESINRQLVWVDTRLEHLAKSDETVERLCTAPSVGPVTAAAFSSTVDDVQRFQSAHQVEAYLGLTPSEWSSGEKQCKGHITKAGNNRMRRLLVRLRSRSCACEARGPRRCGSGPPESLPGAGRRSPSWPWRGEWPECSSR